jgi:hypothetical protein
MMTAQVPYRIVRYGHSKEAGRLENNGDFYCGYIVLFYLHS